MKHIKSFLAGFLACALIMAGTLATLAVVSDTTVSALLQKTLTIMLNGEVWQPVDAAGKPLMPINYNGSVYMPIRAVVQQAAGMSLEYDGPNKTIWVGGKTGIVRINAAGQYADRYGTVLTTDTALLPKTAGGTWSWGVTNDKLVTMQTFGGYFKPSGKYNHFRTTIQLDASAMAPVVFELRKDDYQGEVLKAFTINPGESQVVDVGIASLNQISLLADIRTNHGDIRKIVYGEPIFYNGVYQADGTVVAAPAAGTLR